MPCPKKSALQLFLVQNPYCNHDVKDDINFRNYFEIGKNANECHANFINPLYVPKFSKYFV
jgi:hypothetical protein